MNCRRTVYGIVSLTVYEFTAHSVSIFITSKISEIMYLALSLNLVWSYEKLAKLCCCCWQGINSTHTIGNWNHRQQTQSSCDVGDQQSIPMSYSLADVEKNDCSRQFHGAADEKCPVGIASKIICIPREGVIDVWNYKPRNQNKKKGFSH